MCNVLLYFAHYSSTEICKDIFLEKTDGMVDIDSPCRCNMNFSSIGFLVSDYNNNIAIVRQSNSYSFSFSISIEI